MKLNDEIEFANGLIGHVRHIESGGNTADAFVLEYDGKYVACAEDLESDDDFYHCYEDQWRETLTDAIHDCEAWMQGL